MADVMVPPAEAAWTVHAAGQESILAGCKNKHRASAYMVPSQSPCEAAQAAEELRETASDASTASDVPASPSVASPPEEASSEEPCSNRTASSHDSCESCWTTGDLEADYAVGTRVLGSGASCSVLEATCRHTGQKVAVKSFRRWDMTSRAWDGVKRECAVHHSVRHTNILKVEGVYQEGGDAMHIVMERCTGGELFDRVLQKQGLPEPEAARVAVQLLRAVGYLHARHLTHRDIKPENIMYKEKHGDQVKLLDFGFATQWQDDVRLTQRCGTLQYAAPEVLSEGGYTWRADMWSFGGVVYTSLVARLLYSGSNGDVARKNREGRIDFSRNFATSSWQAQDFVRSLLTIDERRRPSVLEALRHPWLRKHAEEEVEVARLEIEAEIAAEAQRTQDSTRRCLSDIYEGKPSRGRLAPRSRGPKGVATCFAAVLPWCF